LSWNDILSRKQFLSRPIAGMLDVMTETAPDEPFTLAFLGYAPEAGRQAAHAYEDAVLSLLPDHGARVVYRGCRAGGEDEVLPLEVHLLWFPGRAALVAYLADERRAALRAEYGDVFARTEVVTVEER
jgi:hypothetical protein